VLPVEPDRPHRSPFSSAPGRSRAPPRRDPRAASSPPPRRSAVTGEPFARELPRTRSPPRWVAHARHAVWEFDDSSHGVRSPSASPIRAIVVPICLLDTVRSQGFSPSQRFDPARWCGSVSRHIRPWGLVTAFRAFPAGPAAAPLGARCSLVVLAGLPPRRMKPMGALTPAVGYAACPVSPRPHPDWPLTARPDSLLRHQPGIGPTKVGSSTSERPKPLQGVGARCARLGADSSTEGTWSSFGQARACDFRALLRPSVRTRALAVKLAPGPMLS
jgi:hypothetical protein